MDLFYLPLVIYFILSTLSMFIIMEDLYNAWNIVRATLVVFVFNILFYAYYIIVWLYHFASPYMEKTEIWLQNLI